MYSDKQNIAMPWHTVGQINQKCKKTLKFDVIFIDMGYDKMVVIYKLLSNLFWQYSFQS